MIIYRQKNNKHWKARGTNRGAVRRKNEKNTR